MMKNPESKVRKLKVDVFSRNPEDPDFRTTVIKDI